MTDTNFVYNAPASEPNMEPMLKFLVLLNQKFPIDRSIGNFQGNHSIVLGEIDGVLVPIVQLCIWKQLEWRLYAVALEPANLLLSPEALLEDVVKTVTPEIEKLITPSMDQAVLSRNPHTPRPGR